MNDLSIRPRLQVGSSVVAHGFTGTVVDEHTSAYGNRVVEIEFAPTQPSPLVRRDWVPVRYVELGPSSQH